MKYSININQAGIADAGFADKTDLVDWAIVDYIFAWQNNPMATKIGASVWINYKHLISEMPLLGLNTKGAVANRMLKLSGLGLVSITHDQDKRLYAALSQVANDTVFFRSGCSRNTLGVHDGERGVHDGEQGGVHDGEQGGVHDGEHSAVNHISAVNQEQGNVSSQCVARAPAEIAPRNASPSAPPAAKSAKGSRISPHWRLPRDWGEWALREQPTWTAEHVCKIAEGFRDYWISRAGAGARKTDWQATWRNWVRKEKPTPTATSCWSSRKSRIDNYAAQAAAARGDHGTENRLEGSIDGEFIRIV